MRVRAARVIRHVLLAAAIVTVSSGTATIASADPVTVGAFSLNTDDPFGPYVDLVNLTDDLFAETFGAANLSANVYLCFASALDECGFEPDAFDFAIAGPGEYTTFTQPFPFPDPTFLQVVVSLTSVATGLALDGTLRIGDEFVTSDGIVAFGCDDPSRPCTQFIDFTPSTASVPEPATGALLATGLAWLLALRRWRHG